MPAASELPPELVPLAELNALKLRDGDWEADVTKIAQRLEKLGIKRVADSSAPPLVPTKRSAKAIWSLVITALVVIGLADGENDEDTIIGALALSAVALGLAGFAYFDIKQRRTTGKALAIGGLVGAIVTALMAIALSLMEMPP